MRNNKIHGVYMDLQESMERLVRDRNDAFMIIWLDIYDWLEPKDPSWRADLCGVLTSELVGENIGSRVFVPAESDRLYCQEILARYGFGDSIDELGEYWKGLIREDKVYRLRLLLGCLKVYYEEIMPYVKNKMVDFFKHNGRSYPELAPTLKPYKEHQARIKETIRIIEMAVNVFVLQGKDRTDNDPN